MMTEPGQPERLDIISQAFRWDCDLVLQKVFLCLDPHSLKSCRQVCREWNEFIMRRLWRSPYGIGKIRDRLRGLYFTEQPEEVVVEVSRGGVESEVSFVETKPETNVIVRCGHVKQITRSWYAASSMGQQMYSTLRPKPC